jgi:glycosyltransferase involved in cell wall biosynthesis
MISVVIPSRDDASTLASTIRSIEESCSGRAEVEVVVVDDASGEAGLEQVAADALLPVVIVRSPNRLGVARARNLGASKSAGNILFFTDSHVKFSHGWDAAVRESMSENRILAGTVTAPGSAFKGYGCRLAVPYMGTHWERNLPQGSVPVQIAVSVATVLYRDLFFRVGGYDEGMILYGGAEPEFSIRAWLAGAEIMTAPKIEVEHEFKTRPEIDLFTRAMRPFMIHNCLRFGIIYLDHARVLTMLRYHSDQFPGQFAEALGLLADSDVWARREKLRSELSHDFEWFARKFELRDQVGRPLINDAPSVRES